MLAHEWVRPFLCADRRGGAVARIDHRIVGKRKEFGSNALEQLRHVAPQVGPADGAGEKHVAPEHKGGIELVANKDDRAGAVSGDLANLEAESRELDPFAVVDQAVGLGTGDRQSERCAQVGL